LLVCLWTTACEGLREGSVGGLFALPDAESEQREEQHHRTSYQTDRDPDALRWLLANRITTGMMVADVNNVLGEEGQREFNDRRFKTNDGLYRIGDTVYRWGPDSSGTSLYLVFRNDRLINFEPRDYE
jgi:hypothetical protein